MRFGATVARYYHFVFFFSSRRRHTRYWRDWSSDVCSSDLNGDPDAYACRMLACRARAMTAGPRVLVAGADSDTFDLLAEWLSDTGARVQRSGERRGGEEGRSRWSPDPLKKKIHHTERHSLS